MIRKNILTLVVIFFIVWAKESICYGQPSGIASTQHFKKHILTDAFLSEGVGVGDVNNDGKTDIIAGALWFEAPHWKPHEIAAKRTFDPAKEYSNSCHNFIMDVNLDGWVDLIVIGFPGSPGVWYENPKGKSGHWKKNLIDERIGIGNESPSFIDMDGDGRKDLLCADSKARQMVWLRAPTTKGTSAWERFAISQTNALGTEIFSHGLGAGDVNKDGRPDVIIKSGWWEGPADLSRSDWVFHETDLGEDCSHMHVLDVDSDGLNDVVSASAHKYGIWWHQQLKDGKGSIVWKHHVISKSVSQTHALAFSDMNGDDHPDLVTGKRFFAHNDTEYDPGTRNPAVLLWLEFRPEKKHFWKIHEIDNDSGVGLNIITQDITGDGLPDIIISNKKGVFLFENKMKRKDY